MTPPDMESIIAQVIADNSVVIHEHADYGELTASTLTPDEMARAVLDAISEAGAVEWGVLTTLDMHVPYDTEFDARITASKYGGTPVSRLIGPWERAE